LPALSTAQQPFGQALGLQFVTFRAQTRESVQVSKPVETQSLHAAPATPHARVLRPVWHWPFASQQPFEQVAGPQMAGVPLLLLEEKLASRSSGSRLDRPQPAASSMKRPMLVVKTNSQRSKARIPNLGRESYQVGPSVGSFVHRWIWV
jgi:hypothetical protein